VLVWQWKEIQALSWEDKFLATMNNRKQTKQLLFAEVGER